MLPSRPVIPPRAIRIVQLSDLHLTARVGGRVYFADVWRNLDRVLAHVAAQHAAADRIVLTGDLASSGSADAYARLAERLAPFHERVRLVPGNHDRRERLRAAFPRAWPAANDRLAFADEVGGWRLVGLDSAWAGHVRGQLDAKQLQWLRSVLARDARPWLLFVHHPPVPVHTWWLDKDLPRELDALRAVLAANAPRAIFAGHVHHAFDGELCGAPVATAPAVAYQYGPRTWLPLPRSRVPALRVIEAGAAGVTSRVEQC